MILVFIYLFIYLPRNGAPLKKGWAENRSVGVGFYRDIDFFVFELKNSKMFVFSA